MARTRKSALHVIIIFLSWLMNYIYREPHFFHGVSFQLYACLLIWLDEEHYSSTCATCPGHWTPRATICCITMSEVESVRMQTIRLLFRLLFRLPGNRIANIIPYSRKEFKTRQHCDCAVNARHNRKLVCDHFFLLESQYHRLIGFLVIICTNYHTSTSYTCTRPAGKYPERSYAILKRNLCIRFLGNYMAQKPLENCHDENHRNLKFS